MLVKVRGQVVGFAFSLYHMDPRDQIQVVSLSGKHLTAGIKGMYHHAWLFESRVIHTA